MLRRMYSRNQGNVKEGCLNNHPTITAHLSPPPALIPPTATCEVFTRNTCSLTMSLS